MSQPVTLSFELGDRQVRVTVSDIESFLGTLRQTKGVRAVSRNGRELVVELKDTRPPHEILEEIQRFYGRLVTVEQLRLPA